jgi:hypothetical protein
LAASVDPTDARNDILGCVGRFDRGWFMPAELAAPMTGW